MNINRKSTLYNISMFKQCNNMDPIIRSKKLHDNCSIGAKVAKLCLFSIGGQSRDQVLVNRDGLNRLTLNEYSANFKYVCPRL